MDYDQKKNLRKMNRIVFPGTHKNQWYEIYRRRSKRV